MARYIDAEKMQSLLEEEIEGCGYPISENNPIAYGTTLGLKMALSYAKTLPTAEPYQYKPKVCVEDEEQYYFEMHRKKVISTRTFAYMERKYDERKDKDNLLGVGLTDGEFAILIIHELLGEDWYCSDPLNHDQVNEVAFIEILQKYKMKRKKRLSFRQFLHDFLN